MGSSLRGLPRDLCPHQHRLEDERRGLTEIQQLFELVLALFLFAVVEHEEYDLWTTRLSFTGRYEHYGFVGTYARIPFLQRLDDFANPRCGVDEWSSIYGCPLGVEFVDKLGYAAKITPATADTPEEVGVCRVVDGENTSVSGDDGGFSEIVDGQAMSAGKKAISTPERQPEIFNVVSSG